MDPIAMTKSALGILAQFKAQIDEANDTIEEARQLKKYIDVLEVTIMMIPSKSPSGDDKSDTAKQETESTAAVVTKAVNAAKGINDYTMIIGGLYSSIKHSKENGLSNEFTKDQELSPAVVLSSMKNAKDEKTNLRIYTDLDVMF